VENSELYKKLEEELGTAPWPILKAHHRRGALVVVDPSLDLIAVGEAVISDDTETIKNWMSMEQVSPFPDVLAAKTPTMKCLVAQPWVLVQELDAD
jgi:hypothetical protein